MIIILQKKSSKAASENKGVGHILCGCIASMYELLLPVFITLSPELYPFYNINIF